MIHHNTLTQNLLHIAQGDLFVNEISRKSSRTLFSTEWKFQIKVHTNLDNHFKPVIYDLLKTVVFYVVSSIVAFERFYLRFSQDEDSLLYYFSREKEKSGSAI